MMRGLEKLERGGYMGTDKINEPFKGDIWYYVDDSNQRVIEVYFNYDAFAGGQIVESYIPYSLVIEADKRAGESEKEFFSYINASVQMELLDLGTEDYTNAIRYYETNEPTFKNLTREGLVELAIDERTHREYNALPSFIAEDIIVEDKDLTQKEQLQQRLEEGIRSVIDSETFKNWLQTQGTLFYRNYSFQNAMLIWMQKPEASYVMSYEKWKDFGRNVALGAQGAKIFVPLMAYEKSKGILFKNIKRNLQNILDQNSELNEASYRLGSSKLEFTMNRANKMFGYKIDGKERHIFSSEDEIKRFIERAIIGKLPVGFTVGTVFDVKDVVIPEFLWVKRGYTKDELALDANGRIVKNKRGEVRIKNSQERQERFHAKLDMHIEAQDADKMKTLFDVCITVSLKKGVPVFISNKKDDETLASGASGYYSRETSDVTPNGYIVIDEALEPTEKCSVLFHEMGHADLHKNLQKLAQDMGETKISKEMREIQAEAVSYAVASSFGIETDTSSFGYLAIYSTGFELQDFKKSLETIHKETVALVNDIKAELDVRGLDLELNEKNKELLGSETLKTLSTRYMEFYSEFNDTVQSAIEGLPALVKSSINNNELIDILKHQNENLQRQKNDLVCISEEIVSLNNANTREAQNDSLQIIEAAVERIRTAAYEYEALTAQFMSVKSGAEQNLLDEFGKNPFAVIEHLKSKYSRLTELSNAQIKYLAGSEYVKSEIFKNYYANEELLVEKMCERASAIIEIADKNGTFVEISRCEKWTEPAFFENGTLCSPKIADTTVTAAEAQTLAARAAEGASGKYIPYTKCNMTIFTPDENGGLLALHTRVDIGDGMQKSLADHLQQGCKTKIQLYIYDKFCDALKSREYNRIAVPNLDSQSEDISYSNVDARNKYMTRKTWEVRINEKKDSENPDRTVLFDTLKTIKNKDEGKQNDTDRERDMNGNHN